MKIKPLIALALLVAGQAIAEQKTETPLLPEVKEWLAMPAIDQGKMDQNAYVYLLGLEAEGDDHQQQGKRMVLQTEAIIREALQTHNPMLLLDQPTKKTDEYKQAKPSLQTKINGKTYQFPCMALANLHCITDVLQQRTEAKTLADNNALYLKRYQQIIQLPYFDAYYFSLSSPVPAYQYLILLSGLRQAEAITAISQGEIAKGLTILQEEMAFSKRLLAGQGYLIDAMIANRLLMTQYHTLSELIDSPAMANELNNPQFTKLFKPLTATEQQAMSSVYRKEAIMNMQLYEALDQDNVNLFWQKYGVEWQARATPKYPLTYERNKTLNMSYNFVGNYIKLAQVTLPEAASAYIKLQQQQLVNAKLLSEDEVYQQYGPDNFFGGLIFEDGKQTFGYYLYRFYDITNYLTLINAKLAIKQAHITKEQVPNFLQKLGDKAQNPYNKKPFVWDEATQTLSSDWLEPNPPVDLVGTKAKVKLLF